MSELKACERLFDVAIEVFEFDENEEVARPNWNVSTEALQASVARLRPLANSADFQALI